MNKKIALVGINEDLEERIRKMLNGSSEIQRICGIGYVTPYEQLTKDIVCYSNLIIIDGRLSASKKTEPIDSDIKITCSDNGVQRSIQLAKKLRSSEIYQRTPILIKAYEFENEKDNVGCDDFPDLNLGIISEYSLISDSLFSEIIFSNL